MNKDLYTKEKKIKPLVQKDDLVFDGKNLIIPSYYSSLLLDYVRFWSLDGELQVDIEDYQSFRNFLESVNDFKNKKGQG